jgi:hypothetical protein
LPSINALLCGAAQITVTDHPSSPSLTMGAIETNLRGITVKSDSDAPSQSEISDRNAPLLSSTRIRGYAWGTTTFYLPSAYGKPAQPTESNSSFDKIIIADCLWMPSQHTNLIKTVLKFLPQDKANNTSTTHGSEPCALVIAGFHTGRQIVSDFFSLATVPQSGRESVQESIRENKDTVSNTQTAPNVTETPNAATINTISLPPSSLTADERALTGRLKLAEIFEIDVDANTRPWQPVRDREGKWEGKRWCVVGVLVRR